MSGDLDLEQRYRRVLRLLPGYYRRAWEQDMVAAFLESSLTGDPDEDEWVLEFAKPPWREVTSVAGLAFGLYLGGAGAPRRYFAWGQAVRRTVLTVAMLQAVRGLDVLLLTAWSRRVFSWLPVPPATLAAGTPAGIVPPVVWWLVAYAWIVSFIALALGRYYRTAQVIAALAGRPRLPGAGAKGMVPACHWRGGVVAVVAGLDAAGRRSRRLPDLLPHRLPPRPAPDPGEPDGTAHLDDRCRTDRPDAARTQTAAHAPPRPYPGFPV